MAVLTLKGHHHCIFIPDTFTISDAGRKPTRFAGLDSGIGDAVALHVHCEEQATTFVRHSSTAKLKHPSFPARGLMDASRACHPGGAFAPPRWLAMTDGLEAKREAPSKKRHLSEKANRWSDALVVRENIGSTPLKATGSSRSVSGMLEPELVNCLKGLLMHRVRILRSLWSLAFVYAFRSCEPASTYNAL